MRLSARADYALRAAIELASATDSHVTADRIARAQQIPGKFLETILTQLRRAGALRSQRPENIESPGAAEPLQQVWIALRANERAILEEVTLGHIVAGELPSSVRVLIDDPKAWLSAT